MVLDCDRTGQRRTNNICTIYRFSCKSCTKCSHHADRDISGERVALLFETNHNGNTAPDVRSGLRAAGICEALFASDYRRFLPPDPT
jgi:hypothetical protein